ncbi:MAG TPA: VOC family protein [Allosphingosinicella sp.]|nr:VOC family protein [Allosphingosinicella sp.]
MRLHHVGYVVRDIEAFAEGFPGLALERTVDDPLQRARLALYEAGGTYVELIQPEGPGAFTWAHLERAGEGMHHVCYEGVGAEEVDELLARHRMLKIRGPMHAPLFDRPVLFAMTRKKAIVEFIL